MGDRDLSHEFHDLVAQMATVVPEVASNDVFPVVRLTPPYVYDFHSASASVIRLSRLSRRKVEHLSSLVRRSSIFDDATEEIEALIHAINDEVTKASQQLKLARRNSLEPHRSNLECYEHCRAMERQALREVEDASSAFKNVLKLRSDSVKELTERKEKFGKRGNRGDKPKRHRVPVFDGLPRPDEIVETPGHQLPPEQQMDLLIPDQTYHVTRADAATDIESQVQEIGAIFSNLSTLVRQQEEQVERIETNVEQAAADVDRARNVLTDRLNNMDATTKTALKCGGIITASFIVYTIFLA